RLCVREAEEQMKRTFQTDFLYQAFALIIAVLVVHVPYVTVVRPKATAILAEQALRMQQEENYSPGQSFWVVIRDYEQEACFVLALWALAIIGYKAFQLLRERRLLQQELLPVREGVRILPEDTREYARVIQSLPEQLRRMLLPRLVLTSLERFGSTRSVQDVVCVAITRLDAEARRVDSDLMMIRFISVWFPASRENCH